MDAARAPKFGAHPLVISGVQSGQAVINGVYLRDRERRGHPSWLHTNGLKFISYFSNEKTGWQVQKIAEEDTTRRHASILAGSPLKTDSKAPHYTT